MKWQNINIKKRFNLIIISLVFLATFLSCNQREELNFDIESKEIIFTINDNRLYLLGGVNVNQMDLLEIKIQAKDIDNNSEVSEINVYSIPNDGNNPLSEIHIGNITKEKKVIFSMSDIGIESINHKATLKFIIKFNDNNEIIRTFQVKPISPFQYSAPASVFSIIDNVSKISYIINSGGSTVDKVKVLKKVNDGAITVFEGDWKSTDVIPIQGKDYNAGDNVFIQIEATNQNATAVSEWIKVPVIKPEGEHTYIFEGFFEGTPEAGFTNGCWAGVQGGKSFVNTIFNYDGASGGTGAFDDKGWNTLYTHIANTPIVAFSGLVSGNYSSNLSAVGNNKDLLTPIFNMSNTKNNKLQFYYLCMASDDKVNHLIVSTTTDNVTWTQIADLSEQPNWSKQEFSLSPDIIRIKFTGISGGANNVKFNTYIDDIKIFGEF